MIASLILTGCGKLDYSFEFNPRSSVSGFRVVSISDTITATPFSDNLCIIPEDIIREEITLDDCGGACLIDINERECLYSYNAHERLNPASLTKLMTALVAVKNASLDQVLTASNTIQITEYGAQTMNLKQGDSMTLDQALHLLLMYSANDVANLIAENVGGSIEGFVEMMNTQANALGATNTHFMNPHGLTQEDHYSSAYDMYLIMNEVLKYDSITQIMNLSSYQTTYMTGKGEEKEINCKTTNLYLRGEANSPSQVTVLGGKTGTTSAAGHCLVLYSNNTEGKPYISIVLRARDSDSLYNQMTQLLSLIP